MNGRRRFVGFACFIVAILPHCGGTTTSLPSDRDASLDSGGHDGPTPDSETAASDATIADASAADAATGASGDAALGVDGGAAADAGHPTIDSGGGDASGTGAPVPGRVTCGSGTCDATLGQFCCLQADGTASCSTSGGACDALGGVRRGCEKAGDCLAGNVCCYDFSTFPASASCRGDCAGGGGTRVQACRGQAECTAGTCAVHACVDAGSLESCEPHTPERP